MGARSILCNFLSLFGRSIWVLEELEAYNKYLDEGKKKKIEKENIS